MQFIKYRHPAFMKHGYLLILLVFSLLSANAQSDPAELFPPNPWGCWTLYHKPDSIVATVLVKFESKFDCGILMTGSALIVKCDNGDTLRVIRLCGTFPLFSPGTRVLVRTSPSQQRFSAGVIPGFGDERDCRIKNTNLAQVTPILRRSPD